MIHLSEPSLKPLAAEQIGKEQRRGALILDTRATEQFASFHIAGALQIGLMGSFASWAAVLIKASQKLLLVVEDVSRAQEAQSRLARVGLEKVIGYTLADEKLWRRDGIEVANLPLLRGEKIRRALQQKEHSLQLIDVRSRAEWLKGHLPGAISLPLLELNSKIGSIDLSKPSLIYCEEGYRATTAASILLRHKSSDIGILMDGIKGWRIDGHAGETEDLSGRFFASLSQLSDN
jgi:rhodanese-related sulfurtransferase